MDAFAGKVAVVTGASSGLGRALAGALAARGAAVAVSDLDEPGLAETAARIRGNGGRVYAEPLDVADAAAVGRHAARVRAEFGTVHQLYNNAGLAFVGPFEQVGYADIERVMATNFWGVVHCTKEFLPALIESGAGHVVNISSVFGLTAAPWMSGYDASKFAVRGFSDALRGELIALKRPVQVTSVHPGGMPTGIVEHAGAAPGEDLPRLQQLFQRIALTPPDRAARLILRAVQRGKPATLVGPDARLALVAGRLAGARYARLAALAARWFIPSETTRSSLRG